MVDSDAIISDHEKCIKQPVPNVTLNAKYHSSLQKEDQFSAEIAIEKRNHNNSFYQIIICREFFFIFYVFIRLFLLKALF